MITYLKTKSADYSLTLSWIDGELSRLESALPDHVNLTSRLRNWLAESVTLLERLQLILKLNQPKLLPRALPMIHDIEFNVYRLTAFFIPALQKESQPERTLRKVLLNTSRRCGLDWVEDVVVKLDGPLGTYVGLPEAPLLIAPPQQAHTFLDMAGLYHELGHHIFYRFPHIGNRLSACVDTHFMAFRQSAGPINAARSRRRDEDIQRARDYWKRDTLAELFCDVYATYVSGPAHYLSCIDMAVRVTQDPYLVNSDDEHPPLAARVYAARTALTADHRCTAVVASAHNAWSQYLQSYAEGHGYRLYCSQGLLNQLVSTSISCIQSSCPSAQRYREPLPTACVDVTGTTTSLEQALNAGAWILWDSPEEYAQWEEQTYRLVCLSE